ncbi:GtrA family protein [Nocardia puris]|uniref:Putative flippase GtrA n=1 Tax=Nocardia puris TaxID=208602 RepID=A0A366DP25_9NOCA|nr:GtrA family protein [Nocardia puris]RBO91847.1 putative flippase GtrA [Nocardia puris]
MAVPVARSPVPAPRWGTVAQVSHPEQSAAAPERVPETGRADPLVNGAPVAPRSTAAPRTEPGSAEPGSDEPVVSGASNAVAAKQPLLPRLIAGLRKAAAFLVVGAIGFLVDAGTYNVLVFWGGEGPMHAAPLPAKIIAIGVATVVTYFGNKWWTYGQQQTDNPGREYLLYVLINVVAIGLQLGCLGFSRYVLGLSSPLADNISGTLIGQIVAVVFRFWAYDKFVFTGKSANEQQQ